MIVMALPGNPFATDDALYTEDANNEATVNATLVLAYEQRTATLLALLVASTTAVQVAGVDYPKLANQVRERLRL